MTCDGDLYLQFANGISLSKYDVIDTLLLHGAIDQIA